MKKFLSASSLIIVILFFAVTVSAQHKIEMKPEKIADGVYVILGYGGNVLALVNDSGEALVVDSKITQTREHLKEALREAGVKSYKYLLTTHRHYDHVDGHVIFAGKAISIAQEKIRERMKQEEIYDGFGERFKSVPLAADCLPEITFKNELTIHFAGEIIHLKTYYNAHANPDVTVYLEKANILHTGDLFFNGSTPIIETSYGGSAEGHLNAYEDLLSQANENTIIVPGHGKLGKRSDIERDYKTFSSLVSYIKEQIAAGRSLEEIQAATFPEEIDKWAKSRLVGPMLVRHIFEEFKK